MKSPIESAMKMRGVRGSSAVCSLALLGFCIQALLAVPALAQWDDTYDPRRDDERRDDERRYDERPYDERRYDEPAPYSNDAIGFGARMGLGFTDDPKTFLLDLAIPYHTGGGVSVGPRIQLGFADERTIIAPTIGFEYAHDLSGEFAGALGRLRPLIGAGIGFLWLEKENRPGKNTDAGFLLNIGFGAEYALSERFGIASVFDFDISPEDTLGENLIFTWQILQMRVRF